MSTPSRQPTSRFFTRRIWSHDLTSGALALVAVLAVLAAGAAVLLAGIRGSSTALAEARADRATVESLERESTRIEITGWRVWRSRGEFALAPDLALQAIAIVERTRLFYSARVQDSPPDEAAIARQALDLLDAVPELIGAARGEEQVDIPVALERFPEFTEEQEAVHLAWLEVNARQIAGFEERREGWIWVGLVAAAALVLALGLLAAGLVRRNVRLQRDAIARLEQQATTDSLTGLVNQGEFHQRLEAAVAHAHASGQALSVIVLDVDHFKRVNDAHGHQVGDRVLAEIARRIQKASRSEDCVGRVGGEEFAWILPRVAEDDAVEAARRARIAVSSEPVIGVGNLTVSAGVAELRRGIDAVGLYRWADMALFGAKERGRDTIVRHSFGEGAGRGPRILSPR